MKLNHLGRNLETKSIHTRRNLFTIKDFYIFDQKQIRFQFNTPKNTLWGISTLHLIVWNAFLMIKMFQSYRSIMKKIWPKVLIRKITFTKLYIAKLAHNFFSVKVEAKRIFIKVYPIKCVYCKDTYEGFKMQEIKVSNLWIISHVMLEIYCPTCT